MNRRRQRDAVAAAERKRILGHERHGQDTGFLGSFFEISAGGLTAIGLPESDEFRYPE
jgi:hypothetical protein